MKQLLILFFGLLLIPTGVFAEEIPNCGSGTIFDEDSNSCVLEKNIDVDKSQQSIKSEDISNWFKNNAMWFSNEHISDSEYTDALAYLVDEGVIVIQSELSPKTEQKIPDWIITNGKWWANGSITGADFLQGVEYMAKNGIIGNEILKQSLMTDKMKITKESNELGVSIIWVNNDSKSHTISLGTLETGLNEKFTESGLIPSGQTGNWIRIQNVGSFDFFCMVHPWEYGTITVDSDDLEIYYAELEKQKAIEQQILAEQQAKILRNESVNNIKNKFESSIIEILSAEPTEQDSEDFRVFLGEERYQKLQDFNEKYGVGFNPESPLSFQIDAEITLEEEFFVIELMEYWLEFFNQEMSERFIKIDNSFEDTKQQINNLDVSEEEKLQHIKEIHDKKEAYIGGAMSGIKNLILLEEEIAQKKKELQLEANLRGKSLQFDNPICGEGTIMKNGQCVVDTSLSKGGGCLIATATYGSELAPQVQLLRELRDNTLLKSESGKIFMNHFNNFYYSFSPIIADYERENPLFKKMVKIAITPMISSLSILNYVDMDSEVKVLGYGISLIVLNAGMYFVAPMMIIWKIRKH